MSFIVPLFVFIILIFGFFKKVKIFDSFLIGAKSGLNTAVSLIPTLIGLITAVSMLRASGLLDKFCLIISPICTEIGLPSEVVPMMLLRPVSGSGSTALLNSIFEQYSPDSIIGQIASVMCGSTETTFYAISVYCSGVGITKTRHTVFCAVLADIAAAFFSVAAVNILLGR